MIIGHGDIASVLTDRPDVIYFASGISNSKSNSLGETDREKKLLRTMQKNMHLVYFSSLSIYLTKSFYVTHKKEMELMVKAHFDTYTIIRIGNITWGKNPNTFINYLRSHPEADPQPVFRHIIDKEDFLYWVGLAPIGEKHEMNITGQMIWVPDWIKQQRDLFW